MTFLTYILSFVLKFYIVNVNIIYWQHKNIYLCCKANMYRSEKAENLKFREFSKTSFTRLFLCCLLLLSLHVVQCLSAADEENEGVDINNY